MTNRQYVKSIYPNSELRFIVRPRNTMSPFTFYQIRSEELGNGKPYVILGSGNTALEAWKSAKKLIKHKLNLCPTTSHK